MPSTPGPDLLLVAYEALTPDEQEQVFERIVDLRLVRLANEDSAMGRHLSSLSRAAEHVGGKELLTSTSYRTAWRELKAEGLQIENLHSVVRFFGGSWRQAREALDIGEVTTPRRTQAILDARRLGKVWRWTHDSLERSLNACVEDLGLARAPQVAEYESWRQHRLDLARRAGDDAHHIPSPSPFRRRFGSWEKAMLALGLSPDQVAERLERPD